MHQLRKIIFLHSQGILRRRLFAKNSSLSPHRQLSFRRNTFMIISRMIYFFAITTFFAQIFLCFGNTTLTSEPTFAPTFEPTYESTNYPTHSSSYSYFHKYDNLEFSGPFDVTSAGNYVFVTNGEGNFVSMFSYLDISNPIRLGSSGTGRTQFNVPQGIVAASETLVYVADSGNERIVSFDPFNFTKSFQVVFDQQVNGSPISLSFLALNDDKSVLYFSNNNAGGACIVAFNLLSMNVKTYFSSTGILLNPSGLAVSGDIVYVADLDYDFIFYFDISAPSPNFNIKNYSQTAGLSLNDPLGIALNSGQLYVSSIGDPNGKISYFNLPTPNNVKKFPGFSNELDFSPNLSGLCFDDKNRLWVVDEGNYNLYLFGFNSSITFAPTVAPTTDRPTFSPTSFSNHYQFTMFNGSSLNSPFDVSTFNDRVFITSTNDDRIAMFSNLDIPKTIFLGSSGTGRGQFFSPKGIVAASESLVYVADSGNHRIVSFNPDNFNSSFSTVFNQQINAYPISVTFMALSDDKSVLYFSNDPISVNSIVGLNLTTKEFKIYLSGVVSNPRGLVVSGNLVYVAVNGYSSVYFFDVTSEEPNNGFKSIGNIPGLNLVGAFGMALNIKNQLFVGCMTTKIQYFTISSRNPAIDISFTFNSISGMTFDNKGQLWAVDSGTNFLHLFLFPQSSSPTLVPTNIPSSKPSVEPTTHAPSFSLFPTYTSTNAPTSFSSHFQYSNINGFFFFTPYDISTFNDQVFITNSGSHSVLMFNGLDFSSPIYFGSSGAGRGQFRTPKGIVAASENLVYVGDQKNSRIVSFDPSDFFNSFITVFNGVVLERMSVNFLALNDDKTILYFSNLASSQSSVVGVNLQNGNHIIYLSEAVLSNPEGLVVFGDIIFVADSASSSVYSFNVSASAPNYDFKTILAPDFSFANPIGIALDFKKQLFVGNIGGSLINYFSISNPSISATISGAIFDNKEISGMTFDYKGQLWAVDKKNQTLHKFTFPQSSSPTLVPTNMPTALPTVAPTQVPTQVPSQVPTQVPSQVPSVVPTNIPSFEPSTEPTAEPTQGPTGILTKTPTFNPKQITGFNITQNLMFTDGVNCSDFKNKGNSSLWTSTIRKFISNPRVLKSDIDNLQITCPSEQPLIPKSYSSMRKNYYENKFKELASPYPASASCQVTFVIDSTDPVVVNSVYSIISTELTKAIKNGNFTEELARLSLLYNDPYCLKTSTDNVTMVSFDVPQTNSPTSSPIKSFSKKKDNNKLAIGLGIGLGIALVVLIIIMFSIKRNVKKSFDKQVSELELKNDDTREFDMGSKRSETEYISRSKFNFNSINPSRSSGIGGNADIEWDSLHVNDSKDSILGNGSFGVVVKAQWTRAGGIKQDVAVKVFVKSATSESDFKIISESARKEALIMSAAESQILTDCIVKVYGVAEGPLPNSLSSLFKILPGVESVGVVLRYEAGGNLSRYIHERGEIAIGVKIGLLEKISTGLTELHSVGIIHGDIKPDNILLDGKVPPHIRFADFGLADLRDITKIGNESTLGQTSTTKGTPTYCAPEMLVNPFNHEITTVAKASRKTDIYAFSILCWEVLAQEKPFKDVKTEIELCRRVHGNERPKLEKLPPDTPPAISEMIEICWRKERGERLQAHECNQLIAHQLQVFEKKSFDIFFSHAWRNKPFLCHVYNILVKKGYRVWYDQFEMGHNLITSMKTGIENSSVVIVCVNSHYQTRENYMFELREAYTSREKVLVLVTEANPLSWANDELNKYCDFKSNNYVDLSEIASENWEGLENNDYSGPSKLMMEKLKQDGEKLIEALEQKGCMPSFTF